MLYIYKLALRKECFLKGSNSTPLKKVKNFDFNYTETGTIK